MDAAAPQPRGSGRPLESLDIDRRCGRWPLQLWHRRASGSELGSLGNALALAAGSTVTLRVLDGGGRAAIERQQRGMHREIVGGCPDHWWKPTARRTAACTCDR